MIEKLKKDLEKIIKPVVEQHQAFLVELQIRIGSKRKTVQVFADTEKGISIEECATISRAIALVLDANPVIDGPYDLEVSSPGLNKPLKDLRQYQRNIGRTFNVKYKENDIVQTFEGTLISVEGSTIRYRLINNEERIIEFENIIETIVKLPW